MEKMEKEQEVISATELADNFAKTLSEKIDKEKEGFILSFKNDKKIILHVNSERSFIFLTLAQFLMKDMTLLKELSEKMSLVEKGAENFKKREILFENFKAMMISSNSTELIPIRECSICGEEIGYRIIDGEVYFDSNCGCSIYKTELQLSDWDSLFKHYQNLLYEEMSMIISQLEN